MNEIALICNCCGWELEIMEMVKGKCKIAPCSHCTEESNKVYLRLKRFVDSVEESKKAES
jgi:hypothetical protein